MPRNLTVLVLLAVAAAAPSLAQAPADGDVPLVRVMRFDGIIHAASAHAFERALDEAEEVDAELFLVELDTPGGTVDSTRTIVSAILDAEIPVCIYVTPRAAQAASGGFFLLLAADIAAMSPLTTTGAASPVSGTGETKEGDVLMKKIAEDLSALVRAAAKQRGRPVELAEQAVKEAKAWNSAEALEAGLIDLVAQDRESLLAELSGREVVRPDGNAVRLELEGYVADEHQFEFVEEFKNIILHPLVMALLLAGATLGIYVEFQHPGAILPGVVGVVCLLVFLWGSQILPVNFFALALLVLAVVLFILEIKVISFGMLTLAGLACLGFGLWMLFPPSIPALRISFMSLIPILLFAALVVGFVTYFVVKAQRSKITTGREGMVGLTGEVTEALDPEGRVYLRGEYWAARSGEALTPGVRVRVVGSDGLVLVVEEDRGAELDSAERG